MISTRIFTESLENTLENCQEGRKQRRREVVQYITAVFLMSLTQVLSLTLVFQAVLLSKMQKFRSCFPAYNVDFLN